jgi:hypothetical protein
MGIDISPIACRVMAKHRRDVCSRTENELLWQAGRGFVVRDLPSQRDSPTIARRFNAGVLAHGHQSHRDG